MRSFWNIRTVVYDGRCSPTISCPPCHLSASSPPSQLSAYLWNGPVFRGDIYALRPSVAASQAISSPPRFPAVKRVVPAHRFTSSDSTSRRPEPTTSTFPAVRRVAHSIRFASDSTFNPPCQFSAYLWIQPKHNTIRFPSHGCSWFS